MLNKHDLRNTLRKIDHRGYKAYKDIKGVYDFGEFTLYIDHVQGDPFASPSRLRVGVAKPTADFPPDSYCSPSREIALRDFIARMFYQASKRIARGSRGTGKSGLISIDQPGQEILERTSAFILDSHIEARFIMGLPAFGRRIAGSHAVAMFFEELPQIVHSSLFFKNVDREHLYSHIKTAEDADSLRQQLREKGLVAFVADKAVLPRASGVDPRPLAYGRVVPFESPSTLRVEMRTPNSGLVTGMGIREGVTLVVGGGYHGKSTLLRALEMGVYNHVPGDGRERVVTDPSAVKIRAEDGRRIEKVDISPFISNLPFGQTTEEFFTEEASGSTSQAANTIEALEIGAKVLLIDEDTSATNFMIRDHRMQELVSKDKEPITPFLDKIRQLYTGLGISTILVIGGSGDYFDVADCVVCMMDYKPHDLTKQALAIARKYKAERQAEGGPHFGRITRRIPLAHSFNPRKGKREVKIACKGRHSIMFGTQRIDLSALEQLVDISQTRAIGDAIYYVRKYMNGERTLEEIIAGVLEDIREKGLDVLNPKPVGDYAAFRALELAAAINRLRTLKVLQEKNK
ncbi:MAG: ABC-ATPase domain-containing protein [Candidatus Aminicenantes bacterium]